MAIRQAHGTTVGTVASTVTLTRAWPSVQIINRGGDDLYVLAGAVAPVVAADDTSVVPANTSIFIAIPANLGKQAVASTTTVLSVISTLAVKYSVVGNA